MRGVWEEGIYKLKKEGANLLILFDRKGKIVWWEGRRIKGENIENGEGFCRSAVEEAIKKGKEVIKRSLQAESEVDVTRKPRIKTVVVIPVDGGWFYMDSETERAFSDRQIGYAEALAQIISQLYEGKDWRIDHYIGRSDYVKRINEQIEKAARSKEPVLIEGETGVGKTLVAELIHRKSGRQGKFIVIHCANIPAELLEAELFGYRRGAFTGALTDRDGLVKEAAKGTIFFDEIAEMPLQLQAKLLRFVETKKFRRVGENIEYIVDTKVIAATTNVEEAVKKGNFRQDLYYRLSVHRIVIPPLRKRREDIDELLTYYGKLISPKRLSKEAKSYLLKYPWPGNIRELINFLKRLKYEVEGEVINLDEVKKHLHPTEAYSIEENAILDVWRQIENGLNFWKAVKEPFLRRDLNRTQVKAIIKHGLKLSGGSYKKLCKLMNLHEKDYHRFMRFLHEQKLKPK